MNKKKLTVKSYIYCEDCKEFIDLWKYDCIEDTGHDKCKWRYVTEKELKKCVADCEKNGCLKEDNFFDYMQ